MTTSNKIISVPANSARYFRSREDACNQPWGVIRLDIHPIFNYIHNSFFDSRLINHDESYCTINPWHFKETVSYFSHLSSILNDCDILIEIGCGQGEFVDYLRSLELNAIGFDPVINNSNPYLFKKYWDHESNKGELRKSKSPFFIMRCVLPHIEEPFKFLDTILENYPNAIFLIEYQSLDWILKNRVWPQVTHDHVNIFSLLDFSSNYDVLKSGTFSKGEWEFVVLKAKLKDKSQRPPSRISEIISLFNIRMLEIEFLVKTDFPIIIYGAAGKGTVFAHALANAGRSSIYALDSDWRKWGFFLESSGTEVLSPLQVTSRIPNDALIINMNPNHYEHIQNLFEDRFAIKNVGSILT